MTSKSDIFKSTDQTQLLAALNALRGEKDKTKVIKASLTTSDGTTTTIIDLPDDFTETLVNRIIQLEEYVDRYELPKYLMMIDSCQKPSDVLGVIENVKPLSINETVLSQSAIRTIYKEVAKKAASLGLTYLPSWLPSAN